MLRVILTVLITSSVMGQRAPADKTISQAARACLEQALDIIQSKSLRKNSTSTEGFKLSDGANIVLATRIDVDRNGVEYPKESHPTNRLRLEIRSHRDWTMLFCRRR